MREPRVPGRCDSCGAALPAVPDPRVSRSRQRRLCSRTCENREKHRREHRQRDPEEARRTECERKHRFRRLDLAERAITRHGRQEALTAYPCQWCGGWHLGGYAPGAEPVQ